MPTSVVVHTCNPSAENSYFEPRMDAAKNLSVLSLAKMLVCGKCMAVCGRGLAVCGCNQSLGAH